MRVTVPDLGREAAIWGARQRFWGAGNLIWTRGTDLGGWRRLRGFEFFVGGAGGVDLLHVLFGVLGVGAE